nr:hypothetical protein [Tanacetum cinerariifolium]
MAKEHLLAAESKGPSSVAFADSTSKGVSDEHLIHFDQTRYGLGICTCSEWVTGYRCEMKGGKLLRYPYTIADHEKP